MAALHSRSGSSQITFDLHRAALHRHSWQVIVSRCDERKSLAITVNQPFPGWDQVFPEVAMTLAAVDRLVRCSTIFERNVESYRRRAAMPTQGKMKAKPKAKNKLHIES